MSKCKDQKFCPFTFPFLDFQYDKATNYTRDNSPESCFCDMRIPPSTHTSKPCSCWIACELPPRSLPWWWFSDSHRRSVLLQNDKGRRKCLSVLERRKEPLSRSFDASAQTSCGSKCQLQGCQQPAISVPWQSWSRIEPHQLTSALTNG